MKTIFKFTLAFMLLSSTTLFAQVSADLPAADPVTAPADEEKEEEETPGLQISGFADVYYQQNFTEGADSELPLVFPTSFTDRANEFTIGMANVTLAQEFEKVSFVAQLGFGPRAEAANGDVPAVQQLFVTYAPSDFVTFTLGNFGTFVGYEVIDPINVNYSTSYLFSNGPFFHTGIKADFAIAEGFGAMVGVFNDTDSKFDDVEGKHIGAQLSAETGNLAAYLNFLAGKEAEGETDDLDQSGFQVDLTATYEVSETFMLGLNVSDKTSSVDGSTVDGFTGAALYATVGISDGFDLGFRGEYFTGKLAEGVTGDAPSVTAFTLSGNYKVGPLTIIPEVRFDSGNDQVVFDSQPSGIFPSADDNSVAAFILAAVYTF
ncbi:porin [Neolewinella aurantiaca]|uniref:Porin n=1 Tax=Neolewinella aurantiaca TaxID=2602767 RepID=A0A5C7FD83_9BACT|nr:outer membrane beta-barrel protein [Neolewinella aurantiaca]TXF88104.1 porin [Neolewinella aurantiaca]